jgi:exodeoxyribonuclease VII large subunit
MPPEVLSVGQIVRHMRDLIDRDHQLADLWISGEVSNLTHARSGHIYFTIKDENAQLRCAFFRNQNIGQQNRIETGSSLIVHGKVGVYEQRGELQLIVDFVQPAGVGALQAEFERRYAMFEAEGLFALQRKRPLPRFPELIGVVTSADGAALHDVQTVLGRRWPRAQILVQPTLVQGDAAAASVTTAIREIAPPGNSEAPHGPLPDLLIVTRGGGAAEDLWAFNDELVIRAIFGCPIPVISAIGHETDTTLADLVADVRAPTPSAAAELAAPDRLEVQQKLRRLELRQRISLSQSVAHSRAQVTRDSNRLERSLPDTAAIRRCVSAHTDTMRHGTGIATAASRNATTALASRLRTLSPLATLERGYSLVARPDGTPVARAADVSAGDKLELRWRDGSQQARVESDS